MVSEVLKKMNECTNCVQLVLIVSVFSNFDCLGLASSPFEALWFAQADSIPWDCRSKSKKGTRNFICAIYYRQSCIQGTAPTVYHCKGASYHLAPAPLFTQFGSDQGSPGPRWTCSQKSERIMYFRTKWTNFPCQTVCAVARDWSDASQAASLK